jgi:hypothetical protein
MPVMIKKVKGGYSVKTPNRIHAKRTSLKNAKAQERLLNAIEHNPDFVPRKSKRKKKTGKKTTSKKV